MSNELGDIFDWAGDMQVLESAPVEKLPEAKKESKAPEISQSISTPLSSIEEVKSSSSEELPLRGSGYPQEFMDMVADIRKAYARLPRINYDEVYSELVDLSVESCPTPTLQILNDEIQKVQAAKDRLAEIIINVIKASGIKKRMVDILESSWAKYSNEASADKRKSDTTFRISAFSIDYAEIEALYRACMHILKNLDSLHDSLSRRITTIQLQLKLHDTGRGALPDFSFSGSKVDDFSGEGIPSVDLDDKEKTDINDDAIPATSKSF